MDRAHLLQLPARDATVAVLDLELTGLSPDHDRICEVAVVRGASGIVAREFQSLVRPDAPMSPGALACHGIGYDVLSEAPPFAQIAAQVADVLDGAALVAHNLPFDLGFLQRELDDAGVNVGAYVSVDTLMMARRLFAFPRNNLGVICRHLGVELEGAHRALADARATFEVYTEMLRIVDPKGDVTVAELNALVEALAPNSPLRLQQAATLKRAMTERRTVEIDYLSTGDPSFGTIRRKVDIWFMKLPRIQGFCHLRQAERVFRVDRITKLSLCTETFEVPSTVRARIG